ncbi:hypothetical protein J6590_097404, partial [Homalodisca vitripennis]
MKHTRSLGQRASGVIEPLYVYKVDSWDNDTLYKSHLFQEGSLANDKRSNRAVPHGMSLRPNRAVKNA